MRKPVVLAGVALTGLIAGVLVLLFSQTEDAPTVAIPQAAAPIEREAEPAPEIEGPKETARQSVAPVAAVEPEAAGPPLAYRKHLGGVIGRLVEKDGTPVPGKKIEAMAVYIEEIFPQLDAMFDEKPIDFEEIKATTKSGEDGRFRFEGLEWRAFYVLGIDRAGPRATIRFVDKAPNAGEIVDLGDVVLDPFVVFTGRVLDEKHAPVAGARVRASNLPSVVFQFGVQDLKPGFSVAFQEDFGSGQEWRVVRVPTWAFRLLEKFPLPTTLTGEDGTFRLEGVPTGLISVLVDAAALVPLVHGPVPSGDGGERSLGDLEMDDGMTLSGTVVDASDQPIADAEVIAGPLLDMAPVALMVPVGRTDAAGRFEAKGLRDADHAVAARTPRGVEWTLVRDVLPGDDEPKIVIGDSFSATVRAVSEGGDPIPKPQVSVQPISELPLHPLLVPPLPLAGRTKFTEDGAVVVSDLSPGRYAILVRSKGYAVSKVEADVREGSTEVVATLVREFTALVRVVEKGSGAPVEWATVGLMDEHADRAMRAIPVATRRTGKDGSAPLTGLTKGKFKVVVLHPGYAEMIVDLEVPGEVLVVELPEGGSIAGRVHEGGKRPDPDRFVAIGKDEGFPRFNVTDPNGEFKITHLAPGEYTLTIVRRFADRGIGDMVGSMQSFQPERFDRVTVVEGETATIDIDLLAAPGSGPKGRLRGRVRMNGLPPGEVALSWNVRQPAENFDPQEYMSRRKSTVTDASGVFDFGEVLAGTGDLEVRQPGRNSSFNFGRLGRMSLDLAAGETEDVIVDLECGRLRGRVVDERTGMPLGAAEVRLRSEDPPRTKDANDDVFISSWNASVRLDQPSDKDGSFFFDQVPVGKFRLDVERGGYASRRVSGIEVTRGSEPPALLVKLSTGVDVKGKVVLPPPTESDGEMRFAYLQFQPVEEGQGGGGKGTRVDVDSGEFAVEGIMPGKYVLHLWSGEQAYQPLELEVPSQGAEGLSLTFQVQPPPPPQPAAPKDGKQTK